MFSQFLTPKHATKIYFTDAKGNNDTLKLGITPDYTAAALYGGINITNKPFNATLDIRFIFPSNNAKTSIINSEGDCDGPSYLLKQERFIIGFHAKHLPVTMRWDTNFLQDTEKLMIFRVKIYFFSLKLPILRVFPYLCG